MFVGSQSYFTKCYFVKPIEDLGDVPSHLIVFKLCCVNLRDIAFLDQAVIEINPS